MNDAAAVAAALKRHAPGLARAVLETGSCGVHLYRELEKFPHKEPPTDICS